MIGQGGYRREKRAFEHTSAGSSRASIYAHLMAAPATSMSLETFEHETCDRAPTLRAKRAGMLDRSTKLSAPTGQLRCSRHGARQGCAAESLRIPRLTPRTLTLTPTPRSRSLSKPSFQIDRTSRSRTQLVLSRDPPQPPASQHPSLTR